jgi:hypothetical protein
LVARVDEVEVQSVVVRGIVASDDEVDVRGNKDVGGRIARSHFDSFYEAQPYFFVQFVQLGAIAQEALRGRQCRGAHAAAHLPPEQHVVERLLRKFADLNEPLVRPAVSELVRQETLRVHDHEVELLDPLQASDDAIFRGRFFLVQLGVKSVQRQRQAPQRPAPVPVFLDNRSKARLA